MAEIKAPKPKAKKKYCSCGKLIELGYPRTAIKCNCEKNNKDQQKNNHLTYIIFMLYL